MTTKPNPLVHRGEIWLVDWTPGGGSERQGRRPALIVQNEAGNLSTAYPNTIAATISTKAKPVPFHVAIKRSQRNGLREDSYVKCEQLMTISKARLIGKSWGRIERQDL